jgi:hypothetical protein
MEALKAQDSMSIAEHKGRAYFDIIEGIRSEYGLNQIDICRILKVNDRRYSDWKKAGRIASFSSETQPGINIIQLSQLYNKLSSFFETTDGAKKWLNEESDVAFLGQSPMNILENDPNGLFLVNSYLSSRMNP